MGVRDPLQYYFPAEFANAINSNNNTNTRETRPPPSPTPTTNRNQHNRKVRFQDVVIEDVPEQADENEDIFSLYEELIGNSMNDDYRERVRVDAMDIDGGTEGDEAWRRYDSEGYPEFVDDGVCLDEELTEEEIEYMMYEYTVVHRLWMYESLISRHEKSFVSRLLEAKVISQEDVYAAVKEHSAEARKDGEERLNLYIFLVLHGFAKVWRLRKFQIKFMWNIIRTLAENLMGDDWVTEGERIMRKFGWSSIPKMCLASAPRRFGKTVAVATAASGYAILMEDKVQAVFSTGGRASGGMRDYVRKAIVGIGLEDLIQTRGKSSENMYIKTIFDDIYNTSESTIKFLPSDPKVS